MRQVSVIIADDLTYSLNGKMNIFGLYNGDIVIPFASMMLNQFVALFLIETEPQDPFKQITLSVTLPNGQSTVLPVQMESLQLSSSDSFRWSLRWPVAFYNAILTPGQIECKVIHESGEMYAIAPTIRTLQTVVTLSEKSVE